MKICFNAAGIGRVAEQNRVSGSEAGAGALESPVTALLAAARVINA